jgi:YbgC/YbaW family acyl-CoA thioester hydrolase
MSEKRGGVLATAGRRVTMGDTDAAGIIYFASPLRWVEEMFSGWFVEIGHPFSVLFAEDLGTPAVSIRADYSSPLALDEMIELMMRASHVGVSSFAVQVLVTRRGDERPALSLTVHHVFGRLSIASGAKFVPEAMPEWLRAPLAASLAAAQEAQQLSNEEVSV